MQLSVPDDLCQLPVSECSSRSPSAPALVFQELLRQLPAAAGPSFQKHLSKSGLEAARGFVLTESFFVPACVWFLISNLLHELQN